MQDRLKPLLDFCRTLDLADPAIACAALEAEFPFEGEYVQGIAAAMRAGVAAGTMCHKGEDPVRFSRVLKPSEDSHGFSADAVLMSAPGPRHRHPQGEIDLCFVEDGAPTFDGNPPGWTVYPADSAHVPSVKNGKMLILYILPGGEIEFL